MSGAAGTGWEAHLARVILRIAASVVPVDLRGDWLREWEAEIAARLEERRPVLTASLGSLRHAAWLRWDAWWVRAGGGARDLRYAVRMLRRRPLFAFSAVGTLALGLGAVTVVYTVVDGVLLAPLPYPGSDRFVKVETRYVELGANVPTLSVELFTEWRERARGFDVIEAYLLPHGTHLAGAGAPAIVSEARVSPGFLADLLGVEPVLGRLFDAAESDGTGPRVALISEGYWRSRFEGRSDVAGTVVRINGRESEIVGVIPEIALLPDVEIWTPLSLAVDHSRASSGAVQAIGRLDPGVTPGAALAALETAHAEATRVHPRSMSPFAPIIRDYRSVLVADVRTHLLLLMGAVALVLVLGCVNVTNLFLARGAERRQELAVRTSLGAGRRQVIGQVFAEGLLVALLGGLAGVLFARLAMSALLALVPETMPLAGSIELDARVLMFASVVTLGTAILVGIIPALRAMRGPIGHAAARFTATPGQRRTGSALLGLEVAQAAALLVGAALLLNSLMRMATADTGFEPRGLAFVHLDLPSWAYGAGDANRRGEFLHRLQERIETIPGVRSAGIGSATPFTGITFVTGVEVEGGMRPRATDGGIEVAGDSDRAFFSRLHVDARYLAALGVPVVAGRAFRPGDEVGEPVGVINETAARAYWPGEDAIGQRVFEPDRAGGGQWIRVIGIVREFGHPGLPTHDLAELYLPITPALLPTLSRPTIIVRYEGADDVVLAAIRREIWDLDPGLPIPAMSTALDYLGASLGAARFHAFLLASFAGLALLLAAVGIYGVVAHAVARRTREIGIRMALGATARRVGVMIARDGLIAIVIGLMAGLALGALASRLLAGLLFGVEPADPATSAAVGIVLFTVAATAVAVPARRAMAAHPVESLRSD